MGKPDKDNIVPPFIGENIERSKKRKAMIDDIIDELKDLESIHDLVVVDLIEKLEKLRDDEL